MTAAEFLNMLVNEKGIDQHTAAALVNHKYAGLPLAGGEEAVRTMEEIFEIDLTPVGAADPEEPADPDEPPAEDPPADPPPPSSTFTVAQVRADGAAEMKARAEAILEQALADIRAL